MTNILQEILISKIHEVAAARAVQPLAALRRQAEAAAPPRNFTGAIRDDIAAGSAAIIAEIKKASPSKGMLRENFDPAAIAASYALHGATCLSILTDRQFFRGDAEYLKEARAACQLPVLRKDFILDEYQVIEARVMGADCILLIVAAFRMPLAEGEGCNEKDEAVDRMMKLESLAHSLGMAVLIEIHNAGELELALQLDSPLIGINNRNLHTFETSLDTTLELLDRMPQERIVISESGIGSPSDVSLMRDHRVHAFLVGEAFMRADDPGAELARLFR
jgi:indole-3-glycerol phosphate synthase